MCFFNTEGPVRPDDHYAIPPLDRMDMEELLALICAKRTKRYFVLHAPRQTGKTSALKPHCVETFKLSRDPLFIEKVRDIVGLYLHPPERAVVLCVDEKSQNASCRSG